MSLADAVLLAHGLFVAFIVLGLLLTYVGYFVGWRWVRNPWFRSLHLAGIVVVVLQAWLGWICPLTTWEMALRKSAGEATYESTFIAHWVGGLIYYDLPAPVFTVGYTAFGLLVVLAWKLVRPRPLGNRERH